MERLLFFYIWAFSFIKVRNRKDSLYFTSRMGYVARYKKTSPLQRHATLACQLVIIYYSFIFSYIHYFQIFLILLSKIIICPQKKHNIKQNFKNKNIKANERDPFSFTENKKKNPLIK